MKRTKMKFTRYVGYLIFALCVCSLTTSCVTSRYVSAIMRAENAFQHGQYNEAQLLLIQAEKAKRLNLIERADILFRRAQCLEKSSQILDAIGLYKYIVYTYPRTEYSHRANARMKVIQDTKDYYEERLMDIDKYISPEMSSQ